MDLATVITSISSSIAVVATAAYFIKRSLERVVDSKLKSIEERDKLNAAEAVRRKAVLYDKRFAIFRTLIELIYRAKNAARDASTSSRWDDTKECLQRLRSYHNSISELLFEERSMFPDSMFIIAHDCKHSVGYMLSKLHRSRQVESSKDDDQEMEELRSEYAKLDQKFQALSQKIEGYLESDD